MEEAGAFRRAQPFVAVARVEVRAEARRGRAAPAPARARRRRRPASPAARARATIVADREARSAGRGGDVGDEDDARALGARGEQRVDDVLGPRDRQRHAPRGRNARRVRAQSHSHARSQAPYSSDGGRGSRRRARARASARRCSRRWWRSGRSARSSAAAPRYAASRRPHAVEQLGQPAREEPHRLPLELALPRLGALEHRTGAGAERAVVEEGHLRVEQELLTQLGGGRHAVAVCRTPGRCVGSVCVDDGVVAGAVDGVARPATERRRAEQCRADPGAARRGATSAGRSA